MRFRPLLALVLALCLTLVTACSGGAKAVDRANLTYDDIHNTGLANDCPTLPDSARGSIALDAGSKYQLREICMHPSEVYVKGEPTNKRQEAQFVAGKILTRFTTSLDQVYGDLAVTGDGLSFNEQGGIDFQLVTVLLPGGEEVPFVFSSKQLDAKADGAAITTSTDFSGDYRVPSYRTSNFLDPKARGLTTGVEYTQGLVGLGADSDGLERENIKRYVDGTGTMELSITTSTDFSGDYRVPSYRTSNFLDPKARGLTTGVEYTQGLVGLGADSDGLERENIKRYVDGTGTMELSITKVDGSTGEFAGVFTAIQPSDTDMGSKDPLDVKITGQLYGRLEKV